MCIRDILYNHENQVGNVSNNAIDLYERAIPYLDEYREELTRREEELRREQLILDKIAENGAAAHRTKISVFTLEDGDIEFFDWAKEVQKQLTKAYYPDPSERAAKIKQFLKLFIRLKSFLKVLLLEELYLKN